MSATAFWDGDPALAVAYRKAEKIRQKQKNAEAWLNGLYVYRALCSVASAFTDKHIDYPTEPLMPDNQENKDIKKKEAEVQAEMWMKSWASAMQERFKGEPKPRS